MAELVSLGRAARRLGVTARWLRSEADAGHIPCIKAESRMLFEWDALRQALLSRIGTPIQVKEGEVSLA